LERPDARIQESSVEMIRKCSDFATQRLGGSQITGIRAKDGRVAENFLAEARVSGLRPVTR